MVNFNRVFLFCLIAGAAILLIVFVIVFPSKAGAAVHDDYPDVMGNTSIRPQAADVKTEPVVEVQRYDDRDLRGDPAVLIASCHLPRARAVIVDHQKVAMAHRIDQLERENLAYKAQTVTGTMELE